MEKEIISRDEFEIRTKLAAKKMMEDQALLEKALSVKVQAGHDYLWVHQTRWMGEPCLQLTTDLLAIAEIINRCKPTVIVESGVAWGGTTLFLASTLRNIGGRLVIGIDTFIPDDLEGRILSKQPASDLITLVKGSSTSSSTFSEIVRLISKDDRVMVLLDSDHTHDHVFRELVMYSTIVTSGQYLVCGDTAIEFQPPAPLRPREWGKGNNPHTALKEFLASAEGSEFSVDREIDSKLLISNNWGGYLRRG